MPTFTRCKLAVVRVTVPGRGVLSRSPSFSAGGIDSSQRVDIQPLIMTTRWKQESEKFKWVGEPSRHRPKHAAPSPSSSSPCLTRLA